MNSQETRNTEQNSNPYPAQNRASLQPLQFDSQNPNSQYQVQPQVAGPQSYNNGSMPQNMNRWPPTFNYVQPPGQFYPNQYSGFEHYPAHPPHYHHPPPFMMPPPPPISFLDQRCFNLVNAKKGVKRWGKCQLISGYILIFFNVISLISNAFFVVSIGSWSKVPLKDQKGRVLWLNLEEGGLVFMTLLKSIINMILIKWGLTAIKTFKPIVKDIDRQELAGLFGNQNHNEHLVKRSKHIKAYKKTVFKVLATTAALIFVSALYARSYFSEVADQFLDEYYSNSTTVSTNNLAGSTQQNQQPLAPSNSADSNNAFLPITQEETLEYYPYRSNSTENHHGNREPWRHHRDPEIDFDLDSVSKDEAKVIAHAMINWASIAFFFYILFVFSCVSACCVCAINKARNNQKLREKYLEHMQNQQQYQQQHHEQLQPQIAQGVARNGGFQQLPNEENDVSNNNIIPRGVAINSIN